jgi:hypothetical protein
MVKRAPSRWSWLLLGYGVQDLGRLLAGVRGMNDQPDIKPRSGVGTGAFLPTEIRHTTTGMSRLGDPRTNAKLVGHRVQRLLGFWFVYNALGGIDAMIESGLWPRSTAYKQLGEFREFYGCEPHELEPDLVMELTSAASSWPRKYRRGIGPVLDRYRKEHGEPVLDRRRKGNQDG